MKKVLVSLPDGIYDVVHGLKGKLGDSDSEVIRHMVVVYLVEQGHMRINVEVEK